MLTVVGILSDMTEHPGLLPFGLSYYLAYVQRCQARECVCVCVCVLITIYYKWLPRNAFVLLCIHDLENASLVGYHTDAIVTPVFLTSPTCLACKCSLFTR